MSQDWEPLARVLCRVVPLLEDGALEAAQDALAQVPDGELLRAVVHLQRLEAACTAQRVARVLSEHPFRDGETPWDAGLLDDVAPRALAHCWDAGGGNPSSTTYWLERTVSNAGVLASLVDLRPPTTERALAATGSTALLALLLPAEAARLGEDVQAALEAHRPDGVLSWPDATPGWVQRRWQWDRQWQPLEASGEVGEDDVTRLGDRSLLVAGAPVPPQEWLQALTRGLDDLLVELGVRLSWAPREGAWPDGERQEPWTTGPWERLRAVVRAGPAEVRVTAHGERDLEVELPVDVRAPLQEVLVSCVARFAGALLEHLPDLTPHGRQVLQAEVPGSAATREAAAGLVDELARASNGG